MSKKRALISGCSGFIGSHAMEYFLQNTDWEIISVNSWQHKGTPERITEILAQNPAWKDRVIVFTHDLTVPFTETTIKRIGHIDYIINFASDSHVDRSIEDPVPFIKNNVDLALTMLEFARKAKPEIFVHVSTDEVYSAAPVGTRYKEWSEILPSNPYASSKACQEAIAISYWRTYGVPVVITNTVNNFGERQDTEKYLARLIKMISRDETVTVHGTPDNIGGRYYLHAKNHASAIKHIIENKLVVTYQDSNEKTYPARYNVTSDDEVDNLAMAHMVAEIMGKELKYELVDAHSNRPGHDRRYALDGTKLQDTGWNLEFPLQESLKNYISWTLQNKHWS
jgi:dTDP-glucose 4,6-dehydratase